MKDGLNVRMKQRNCIARLAATSRWATLVLSVALALVGARIAAPPLRAADQNSLRNLMGQTQEEADRKSAGCISCHTQTDEPTMHATGTVRIGCTDCHGGNADARITPGAAATSPEYEQIKRKAHPQPRDGKLADRSANPERTYTEWLKAVSYTHLRAHETGRNLVCRL